MKQALQLLVQRQQVEGETLRESPLLHSHYATERGEVLREQPTLEARAQGGGCSVRPVQTGSLTHAPGHVPSLVLHPSCPPRHAATSASETAPSLTL